MTTPDISVVMSVYNGARRLREALDSVLSQEGVALEFIAVNDGSTDESGAILAEVASKDGRLRVIEQENAGLTKALIRGCAEARGRFIARQDSDDLSLPGRLAKQAAMLDADERLAFVSCWAYVYGPEAELLCEHRRPEDAEAATHQLRNEHTGPPGHGTVMMRREAYEKVGGYRAEFYYGQDGDLWLRLGDLGLLAYCPEFLYAFEFRGGSISAANRGAQRALGLLSHACRAARQAGHDEAPLLAEASHIRPPFGQGRPDITAGPRFIAGCLRANRDPRAARYCADVLRRRPWSPSAWAGLIGSKLTARAECARNVTAAGVAPPGGAS